MDTGQEWGGSEARFSCGRHKWMTPRYRRCWDTVGLEVLWCGASNTVSDEGADLELDTLASTLENILSSIDNGKACLSVCHDLSAAFDNIDHQLLLWRLTKSFSVSEATLNWLRSYLNDHNEQVSISTAPSELSVDFRYLNDLYCWWLFLNVAACLEMLCACLT